MRKLLFFIFLAMVLSCNKHDKVVASLNHIDYHEEYIPIGEVEEVPLGNGEFVYLDLKDSTYFLGDMLFSKEQIESFSCPETKAAFRTETSARWSGVVKYYISSGFTTAAENAIRAGVAMIESAVTSITFQESFSLLSSNGINFRTTSGSNHSPIGKQSINDIYLQYDLTTAGIAAHEIMHSLGYFHEQSRTDRDSYIIINYNNIQNDKVNNFKTFTQKGYIGNNYSTYDYQSIMHYGSFDFAINSSIPTITKLDGTKFNKQRTHLTNGDLAALDRLYGPIPYISSTVDHIDDYSSGDDIMQNIYYTNRIYFRDLANNNISINYPKTLKVTLTIYHYEETNPGNNYISYSSFNVNVPSGSTYYALSGYTTHRYHESYGISYLIHEEDYSVEILP